MEQPSREALDCQIADANSRSQEVHEVSGGASEDGASPPGIITDTLPMQDITNVICTASDSECNSELSKKIIAQCEFYFSDPNILKDQFMLNQVKRAKDGWVKLSIIAGFKRVQKLCKDVSVIARVLNESELLEMSEDGTMVRRRNPLPEWDPKVYQRTLIISCFNWGEKINVDYMKCFFESTGLHPVLIRVLSPGRGLPPDLKRSKALHSCLGSDTCAVIEMESHEAAETAASFVRERWPNGYVHFLSDTTKVKSAEKIKPKRKVPKAKTEEDTSKNERRPLVLRTSTGNGQHVVHIREPYAPPSETSVGFTAGWRDALRLELLSVGAAQQ